MAETIRIDWNVINRVRYTPELIPANPIFSIAAGKYASPAIVGLNNLNPKKIIERIVALSYISQPQNPSVDLEITSDSTTLKIDTESVSNYPEIEELYLPSVERLKLNYKNTSTTDVTNYNCLLGIWVLSSTVIEKMMYVYPEIISKNLSEDVKLDSMVKIPINERKLAKKYGVLSLVEKGTHPIVVPPNPLKRLGFKLEREYQTIREEVNSNTVTAESNQDTLVFDIKADEFKGEFVVLEGLSSTSPPDVSYGTQLWVDRDTEGELFRLNCYGLGLDWYVPCWIPAVSRLRVYVYTDTTTDVSVKVRYRVCRLNNILMARWFYDDFIQEHPELTEFAERVKLGIW